MKTLLSFSMLFFCVADLFGSTSPSQAIGFNNTPQAGTSVNVPSVMSSTVLNTEMSLEARLKFVEDRAQAIDTGLLELWNTSKAQELDIIACERKVSNLESVVQCNLQQFEQVVHQHTTKAILQDQNFIRYLMSHPIVEQQISFRVEEAVRLAVANKVEGMVMDYIMQRLQVIDHACGIPAAGSNSPRATATTRPPSAASSPAQGNLTPPYVPLLQLDKVGNLRCQTSLPEDSVTRPNTPAPLTDNSTEASVVPNAPSSAAIVPAVLQQWKPFNEDDEE